MELLITTIANFLASDMALLGAGIAALTGLGAGIGMGIATGKAVEATAASRKQSARSVQCFCSASPLRKRRQFTAFWSVSC